MHCQCEMGYGHSKLMGLQSVAMMTTTWMDDGRKLLASKVFRLFDMKMSFYQQAKDASMRDDVDTLV